MNIPNYSIFNIKLYLLLVIITQLVHFFFNTIYVNICKLKIIKNISLKTFLSVQAHTY